MQSTNRYITDRDIAYLYLFELAATVHTFFAAGAFLRHH